MYVRMYLGPAGTDRIRPEIADVRASRDELPTTCLVPNDDA